MKFPDGSAAKKLEALGSDEAFTSIIVAAELRFGARKIGSGRLTRNVERMLQMLQVVSFEAPVEHVYAEMRSEMERHGKSVSEHDMLIASHALLHQAVMVTANEREFGMVPGLKIENWLR